MRGMLEVNLRQRFLLVPRQTNDQREEKVFHYESTRLMIFLRGKKNPTKSLPPTGDGELLPPCGEKLTLQSDFLFFLLKSALLFFTLMILYSFIINFNYNLP